MKNIIVREYLESLTERDELDFLFPILLEVMDFKIISTPENTKGLPQYGKDVVAVGRDRDGITKRFYFEVKGGADRHVTTTTYNKSDGIRESIIEAKDRPYKDSSHPEFNSLPVKIVLVHNGSINANVKETFDGFIEREFPPRQSEKAGFLSKLFGRKESAVTGNFEFERWDIYALTELFTNHLFNEYLLTDEEAVKHFKKVLVLINTPRNNYADYFLLVNSVFKKAGVYSSMGERKKLLFFESLNLISFIVYTYSKEAGNREAAKKCMPYSVLKLWHWILENGIEKDEKVKAQFQKHLRLFTTMLQDYITITLPVASLKNGILAPSGGRYEQVGYPMRTFEYLTYLVLSFEFQKEKDDDSIDNLIGVLNGNHEGLRPLVDNHSIPICLVLNYLLSSGRKDDAKVFLQNCIAAIVVGYRTYKRLPDGRSNIETVLRYIVSRQKSIYYEEQTSHLMAILCDYLALLDMENVYKEFKDFIQEIKVDLGIFVPFTDEQLKTYLPEVSTSHELKLFDHEFQEEGYQSEIRLDDNFNDFKEKRLADREFSYSYRTVDAGFPELITLAHVYFKTPFFPDYWKRDGFTSS